MRAARRSFPLSRTSTLPRSSRATCRALRAKNARPSGRAGRGGSEVDKSHARSQRSECRSKNQASERDSGLTSAFWLLTSDFFLRRTLSRLLQVSQHLSRMAFRLHLGKDVLNLAIRPYDERGPHDAHHLLAVHVLHLQHAKRVRDFLVGVGQQRKRQLEFFLKFLLRLGRVRRDAK